RRRRWSSTEKERLVAATLEPCASVSAIAREAGVYASQLYGLAASVAGAPGDRVAPGGVGPGAALARVVGPGGIEIEFASGARMRVTGAVEPALLQSAIAALCDGRRR